jgi:hypothetical protein
MAEFALVPVIAVATGFNKNTEHCVTNSKFLKLNFYAISHSPWGQMAKSRQTECSFGAQDEIVNFAGKGTC